MVPTTSRLSLALTLEGVMSNDTIVQQAVLDELAWEPSVTAAHIGVAVHDGIVTLSGHVPTFWEKQAAEAAAARVKGVRAVVEELRVALLGNPVTDECIAEAALERIAKDSGLPKDRIQVHVENGHVTLTGEVDWKFQKAAAKQAVSRLPGVTWVTNKITLHPPTVASGVRDKIEMALRRVAPSDIDNIFIEDEAGKITLRGQVRTLRERGLVETAAWSVPGVIDVDDRIDVVW
jgi:osmotically-inducible protein OsmY